MVLLRLLRNTPMHFSIFCRTDEPPTNGRGLLSLIRIGYSFQNTYRTTQSAYFNFAVAIAEDIGITMHFKIEIGVK